MVTEVPELTALFPPPRIPLAAGASKVKNRFLYVPIPAVTVTATRLLVRVVKEVSHATVVPEVQEVVKQGAAVGSMLAVGVLDAKYPKLRPEMVTSPN
jgi:hypothetical protein